MNCFIDTRSAKNYLKTIHEKKVSHYKTANGITVKNDKTIIKMVTSFNKIIVDFENTHKEVVGCDELLIYEYKIRNSDEFNLVLL